MYYSKIKKRETPRDEILEEEIIKKPVRNLYKDNSLERRINEKIDNMLLENKDDKNFTWRDVLLIIIAFMLILLFIVVLVQLFRK